MQVVEAELREIRSALWWCFLALVAIVGCLAVLVLLALHLVGI